MATHMTSAPRHRTALVHEWLTDWGGSESVLAAISHCVETPVVHALIDFLAPEQRARIRHERIVTSFIQSLPFARSRFWNYLPLMPYAVEEFDLRGFDIVVSSSHAFAKGALTSAEQFHLGYVHSPMRYAWDLHREYLADYGLDRGLRGLVAKAIFHRLRMWDRQTANNVDLMVANSRYVARRIWRTYRRPAAVVHPPVEVDSFTCQKEKDNYYITVSRLVSYKRIDLIVEAMRECPERRLLVIGDGPEAKRLAQIHPSNVTLLGYQPDGAVRQYMQNARAFIFAATEDFGITPVEAQACGTPVIAYGRGGVRETVLSLDAGEDATGVFFNEQSVGGVLSGIRQFESDAGRYTAEACRRNAERFSRRRFHSRFINLLEQSHAAWLESRPVEVFAANAVE